MPCNVKNIIHLVSIGSSQDYIGYKQMASLTRAVLGQILVFALFLLSKGAAGLGALCGLAFTCHPPGAEKRDWGLLTH